MGGLLWTGTPCSMQDKLISFVPWVHTEGLDDFFNSRRLAHRHPG